MQSEAVRRMESLAFMLGDWDLDYTYSTEPGGPTRNDLTGSGTIRSTLGGTFLTFDYQVRGKEQTDPSGSAHGVFAWDSTAQQYRYFWFESSGAFRQAVAHLRDPGTLFLDWEGDDCTQTFHRVADDMLVLEMTCPTQGLTLRVDMRRSGK
jgi:hypothetical protein